jgi:hypothetical protein
MRDPKKQEDVWFCRVQYNASSKFFIALTGVRLAKLKRLGQQAHAVSFKLPPVLAHPLMDLESWMLDQTKDRCSQWFNMMTPELIEEYFSSNFAIDKQHGDVFKMLVNVLPFDGSQVSTPPLEGAYGDAVLQLLGVRFYKKKFSLVWTLERFEPYATQPDSDDDEDGLMRMPLDDDVDLIGPDLTVGMCEDLVSKVHAELEQITQRAATLNECLDLLAKPQSVAAATLDRVADLLAANTMA